MINIFNFSKLKIGDILTIDGEEFQVSSVQTDSVFVYSHTNSYFHYRFFDKIELERLNNSGRLSLGRQVVITGGSDHIHSWKIYKGLTEVYDYCECGAKKKLDWRTIGDSKRKIT